MQNTKTQSPRVIVVTGAAAGVGRAIAREFGKEKAMIGLIARGQEALEGAKKEIEEMGGQALVLPLDVADAEAVETAATIVETTFGPIDVWINNAMVSVFSPVIEMKPEEYQRVTEVTYLGYVYGTLAALKRMLPRNRGVIIQVGSALAYRSIPLQSAYCGAKHAIAGFTESLRTELLHDQSKVQVCEVNLPAVNTPQFGWVRSRLPRKPQPVPPIYQPEVIARAIRHVSLHPRRKLEVAFSTWIAVHGEKLAPGLGDWYLARHGYKSQQTDTPSDPDRPDNLWNALPGDPGAHGDFDSKARSFSLSLWLDLYRAPLFFGLLGTLMGAMLFRRLSQGRSTMQTLERVFEANERAA
jgi:NADP-dependent 3-hydroxy acid dehydrogenase YdfG